MLRFFEIIIRFLNEKNIPYMLSGSVAMSIYIVPLYHRWKIRLQG